MGAFGGAGLELEDVLTSKLLALDEHALDDTSVVGIARALRERIDWPRLRAQTGHSPCAAAFFALVDALGVAPAAGGGERLSPSAEPARVRVLSGVPAEARR